MRIVSNFSDIYDQCAMHGIDSETVYRRFTEVQAMSLLGESSFMARHVNSAKVHSRWYKQQIRSLPLLSIGKSSIMFFVVGEEVIPFVGAYQVKGALDIWNARDGVSTVSKADDVFSSIGRAFSSYAELVAHLGAEITPVVHYRHRLRGSESNTLVDFNEKSFLLEDAMSTSVLMKPFRDERWALSMGAPLGVVIPTVIGQEPPMRKDRNPRDIGGAVVVKNPSVRLLGLANLMDPYAIHQEISMALNGFLANRDEADGNISDKDMASAKGFGERSFTTRPGSKKPRRKKRD